MAFLDTSPIGKRTWRFSCSSRSTARMISYLTQSLAMLALDNVSKSLSCTRIA